MTKAYCETGDNIGEVCFNPKKLPNVALLNECKSDCNTDKQCARGLVCAAAHAAELTTAGLDVRKSYCPSIGGDVSVTNDSDVCYDPTKIVPKKQAPLDGQCPHPTPQTGEACNPADYINSECYIGSQSCCRLEHGRNADGALVCGDEMWSYNSGCFCDAVDGWQCWTADQNPDCVDLSTCSN